MKLLTDFCREKVFSSSDVDREAIELFPFPIGVLFFSIFHLSFDCVLPHASVDSLKCCCCQLVNFVSISWLQNGGEGKKHEKKQKKGEHYSDIIHQRD